jgi:uncharacterized membrane protein YeiB
MYFGFGFVLSVCSYVGAACWVAYRRQDEHTVQMAGALLAALAALLVIYQVRQEMRSDESDRSERRLAKQHLDDALSEDELLEFVERRSRGRHSRRIGVVVRLAVLAATGELMHGFGHLLYRVLKLDHEFSH